MNANRRKQLQTLWDKLESIRIEIEALQEEEQEAYDNMPESLQDGERGEKMQSAIDAMDYAASSIQDAMDNIEEAQE